MWTKDKIENCRAGGVGATGPLWHLAFRFTFARAHAHVKMAFCKSLCYSIILSKLT